MRVAQKERDGMIKVMLLGDSIRMNYQERVRQILGGRASILAPAENCRFAAYILFSLSTWVPDDDYDVIHWNSGQWDTCYMPDGRIHTPLPLYLDLHKRIADILRPKAKRLIFATTSPVHPDQFKAAVQNGRKNKDIVAYNRAVVRELSAMGIEINDLHEALARGVMKYISADKVHLSPDGVELCARVVSDAIIGRQGARHGSDATGARERARPSLAGSRRRNASCAGTTGRSSRLEKGRRKGQTRPRQ
jgi:isoamyl acetate esterase